MKLNIRIIGRKAIYIVSYRDTHGTGYTLAEAVRSLIINRTKIDRSLVNHDR
jgi:predicted signal transduction protein with EAL and GGDEF domain